MSAPARLFIALLLILAACDRADPGSPEAVADAFVEAYFARADQAAAKAYTAFGASKMLEREIADTKALRESGYTPSEARLEVTVERGERRARGERVRFDYAIRYQDSSGAAVKRADVELSQIDGSWKVVRLGLFNDGEAPVE